MVKHTTTEQTGGDSRASTMPRNFSDGREAKVVHDTVARVDAIACAVNCLRVARAELRRGDTAMADKEMRRAQGAIQYAMEGRAIPEEWME